MQCHFPYSVRIVFFPQQFFVSSGENQWSTSSHSHSFMRFHSRGNILCVCVSLAVKAAISFWDSPTCSRFSLSRTFINNEKVHLRARVRNIICFHCWMMEISCPYPFCSNPHAPPPHHIRLMAMRGLTRAATIILLSPTEQTTLTSHPLRDAWDLWETLAQ